jgi:hypothetical protein
MKIKTGYLLRDIAGQTIVVPVGMEAVSFNGIISLNKTGRELWNALQVDRDVASLVTVLTSRFEVDPDVAKDDVESFIAKLKMNSLLE